MNRLFLSVFLVGLIVVAVVGAPKTFEENVKILRKIDFESIKNNDRVIKNYIDCVTGEKRCTTEGTAIKESWKEGLDKGCDNCEEEDKRKIKKIAKHIYVNHPEWYKLLKNSLDKEGKYQARYQKYIDEILADPTL